MGLSVLTTYQKSQPAVTDMIPFSVTSTTSAHCAHVYRAARGARHRLSLY
jgi:hypothetical protein